MIIFIRLKKESPKINKITCYDSKQAFLRIFISNSSKGLDKKPEISFSLFALSLSLGLILDERINILAFSANYGNLI